MSRDAWHFVATAFVLAAVLVLYVDRKEAQQASCKRGNLARLEINRLGASGAATRDVLGFSLGAAVTTRLKPGPTYDPSAAARFQRALDQLNALPAPKPLRLADC